MSQLSRLDGVIMMTQDHQENVNHVLSTPLQKSRKCVMHFRGKKETSSKEVEHAEVLHLNLVVWKIWLRRTAH